MSTPQPASQWPMALSHVRRTFRREDGSARERIIPVNTRSDARWLDRDRGDRCAVPSGGRVTHVRYAIRECRITHGHVENLISFWQLSHTPRHQMHWHIGWLADWHNENITLDIAGRAMTWRAATSEQTRKVQRARTRKLRKSHFTFMHLHKN